MHRTLRSDSRRGELCADETNMEGEALNRDSNINDVPTNENVLRDGQEQPLVSNVEEQGPNRSTETSVQDQLTDSQNDDRPTEQCSGDESQHINVASCANPLNMVETRGRGTISLICSHEAVDQSNEGENPVTVVEDSGVDLIESIPVMNAMLSEHPTEMTSELTLADIMRSIMTQSEESRRLATDHARQWDNRLEADKAEQARIRQADKDELARIREADKADDKRLAVALAEETRESIRRASKETDNKIVEATLRIEAVSERLTQGMSDANLKISKLQDKAEAIEISCTRTNNKILASQAECNKQHAISRSERDRIESCLQNSIVEQAQRTRDVTSSMADYTTRVDDVTQRMQSAEGEIVALSEVVVSVDACSSDITALKQSMKDNVTNVASLCSLVNTVEFKVRELTTRMQETGQTQSQVNNRVPSPEPSTSTASNLRDVSYASEREIAGQLMPLRAITTSTPSGLVRVSTDATSTPGQIGVVALPLNAEGAIVTDRRTPSVRTEEVGGVENHVSYASSSTRQAFNSKILARVKLKGSKAGKIQIQTLIVMWTDTLADEGIAQRVDVQWQVQMARTRMLKAGIMRGNQQRNIHVEIFEPGEAVLLRVPGVSNADRKEMSKLWDIYQGHHYIQERVLDNTYKLGNADGSHKGTYNVRSLRRYHQLSGTDLPAAACTTTAGTSRV